MSEIRRCDEDGYFDADHCPNCGERGTHVLGESRRETLSRFLSYALRHDPSDVGIDVDDSGWANAHELADRAEEQYGWADVRLVAAVVATDQKGRFEVNKNRVRAAYGHSIDVDLESDDSSIPDTLYHGTSPANVDKIMTEGLKPMNRQSVHLTDSREDALDVGRRHADEPVLLEVDAAQMQADGHDIDGRGDMVYTTSHVPTEYLSKVPASFNEE